VTNERFPNFNDHEITKVHYKTLILFSHKTKLTEQEP
jgi:hypothetical protein